MASEETTRRVALKPRTFRSEVRGFNRSATHASLDEIIDLAFLFSIFFTKMIVYSFGTFNQ